MSLDDQPLLEIKNIKFAYEKKRKYLLDDLSLNLMNNEIVAIVGNNGAGKSTLLKIIARLLPYEGSIIFKNSPSLDIYSYKKQIAYLPDKPLLYDSLNAYQNLKLICNLWLIKNEDKYMQTAKKLLSHFDLINDIDLLVEDYSLGMRDKLYFIACLARKPKLILLDEPFSSWDSDSFNKGINLLKKYTKDNTRGVLFVTHSNSLKEALADRVLQLNEGKLSELHSEGGNHN